MAKKRKSRRRTKVRVALDVDVDINVRQRRARVKRINNRRRMNLREMRRGMGGLTAANLKQPSFFGNTALLSNAAQAQINNQKYETERELRDLQSEVRAIANAPPRAQQQHAQQIAGLQNQIAGLQQQQQQQNVIFQDYQRRIESGARQFVGRVAEGVGNLRGQVDELQGEQAARDDVDALSAAQLRTEVARRLGVGKNSIAPQFLTANRVQVNALLTDPDSPAKDQLLQLLRRSKTFTKAESESQPQPQPEAATGRIVNPLSELSDDDNDGDKGSVSSLRRQLRGFEARARTGASSLDDTDDIAMNFGDFTAQLAQQQPAQKAVQFQTPAREPEVEDTSDRESRQQLLLARARKQVQTPYQTPYQKSQRSPLSSENYAEAESLGLTPEFLDAHFQKADNL
jgi:hypothetical protein